MKVMEVMHEGEDKDIQDIDEYLKDPLQIASPMVKTVPCHEEGAEGIPPTVTSTEMEVARVSTPSTEEKEDIFQLPVTQNEAAMKKLEEAVAESSVGALKPPGLGLLRVSIPLTRVKVPTYPKEVQVIYDLYYQELKEEPKAKTKKSKQYNPRRQLTVDDYYSNFLS